MNFFRRIFIRTFHWEYWSSTIVYLPLMPYLVWLWVRNRSVFFFNTANPGIEYGGFTMESKYKLQQGHAVFPEGVLIKQGISFEEAVSKKGVNISYPFIAKPDIGNKGKGVAVIHYREEWSLYHKMCPVDYLVQQKINFPMEAGIFYVRFPWEKKGRITGITEKEFIRVKGNGKQTIEELLAANPRYFLQLGVLRKLISKEEQGRVPAVDEELTVISIGNHARGALFTDATSRVSPLLEQRIDKLAKTFKGFYFGRLDIRFNSWEELAKGKSFSLIELNGSGSEPTHIYDPSHTIFFAWREIVRHWNMLADISRYNRKAGVNYLSFREGIEILGAHMRHQRLLKRFQFSPEEVAPVRISTSNEQFA